MMVLGSKKWLFCFTILTAAMLALAGAVTVIADPFFHYRAPDTNRFYYFLNNERSQNDGIMRHFAFDGIITGTSMCQNFRTSEAEALFGGTFVKLPYAGATYRELNEGTEKALSCQPALKTVIRGVDMKNFFGDKDAMRDDMGDYPWYLTNDFLPDDVYYIWNREILFWRSWQMFRLARIGNPPGIDSFDRYSYWMPMYTGEFGKNSVLRGRESFSEPDTVVEITEKEREAVRANIVQNVTDICARHPDVTFYYFFPPYSMADHGNAHEAGETGKRIEAERIAIELMLAQENVRLFSFNLRTDITADLNHYKDAEHYDERINTEILAAMHEGKDRLTKDNYEDYLERERTLFETFDYNALFDQEDYEDPPPELE